jgi:histidine ammonia-lyase
MVDQVLQYILNRKTVKLSASEISNIRAARQVVLAAIGSGNTVYGINTGFGKLSQFG